ncbi:GtrA family protein [Curtobacterium aurantiacum]|uniref:GtrA family protein n=1 Tax=Curtobacterium aurantiacum TaxID=3236919 RepID=A0ABS5VAX9_9MICO|nr:GtrA family protein [Curtobacterium flaccumfaciens]MBT1543743.1 GtrA family protein [Curtobacterium flaccumfaciens pv. flaccumfaciens]MBT1586612.1 GtrA family protein [Curtobacterium flaccumfaciens pv. flaccumfaciens]MBT1678035.1 GtrA family protein [Curtobacterium flaccumfaciens pv. flaccumfaciens]
MRRLIAQLARFGVVGAVGFVVDTTVFNVLRITVLNPEDVHSGPFWAKVISTVVAIFVNWMGNRYWTFREQRRAVATREGIEFVVVSLGGMVIALACLGVSHYVMGLTSVLADNVANVIGLALGTVFRFWLYKVWVYHPERTAAGPLADADAAEPEPRVPHDA